MIRFEELKNMDIDEFAKWIDENGQFDNSPWMTWWDELYCQNCEAVMCHHIEAKEKLGFEPFYEKDVECAYCEIYKKCKYFLD